MNNTEELILIDDDQLIHDIWKMVAKSKNKILHCYYDVKTFLSVSTKFSPTIPIFIDSNLGKNIRGEIISREISNAGFINIILQTGYELDNIPAWIKYQQGKGFPENL